MAYVRDLPDSVIKDSLLALVSPNVFIRHKCAMKTISLINRINTSKTPEIHAYVKYHKILVYDLFFRTKWYSSINRINEWTYILDFSDVNVLREIGRRSIQWTKIIELTNMSTDKRRSYLNNISYLIHSVGWNINRTWPVIEPIPSVSDDIEDGSEINETSLLVILIGLVDLPSVLYNESYYIQIMYVLSNYADSCVLYDMGNRSMGPVERVRRICIRNNVYNKKIRDTLTRCEKILDEYH